MPRRVSDASHGHSNHDPPSAASTAAILHTRNNASRPDMNKLLPDLPPPVADHRLDNYELPALRQKPIRELLNTTPPKHTRAFSHPFPSLFGPRRSLKEKGQRNKGDPNLQDSDSTGDDRNTKPGEPPKTPSKNGGRADLQPVTGQCMTCASTVRWPQGLKVYRCTTCLTINDLELSIEQNEGSIPASPSRLPRKPVPLSVDTTKTIIDSCIQEYIKSQIEITIDSHPRPSPLQTRPSPSHESPHYKSGAFSDLNGIPAAIDRPRPAWHRAISESSSQASPIHPPIIFDTSSHAQSNSQKQLFESPIPLQHGGGQQEIDSFLEETTNDSRASAAIFRPLENYIASCFTGCTTLNASFLLGRPIDNHASKLDNSPIKRRQISEPFGTPMWEPDVFLSEVDAKTLLLGDVAENGSWWTGNRPRGSFKDKNRPRDPSPEKSHSTGSLRNSKIDWNELAEWYRVVINTSSEWRHCLHKIRNGLPPQRQSSLDNIDIRQLQHCFLDSQMHLQRSLLKSTENLLKRPRQPLKSIEDSRFLLMLLANPLLHVSSAPLHNMDVPSPYLRRTEAKLLMTESTPIPRRKPTNARKPSSFGHHSGIIKRILGLMSNLPNEVHQNMIAWFARFSDIQFQRTVEIIGSFVTYRLARQQNRPAKEMVNPTDVFVPSFSDSGMTHPSQLHAALDVRPSTSSRIPDGKPRLAAYSEDWQVRAAARIMALLFQANTGHFSRKRELSITLEQRMQSAGLNAKYHANSHGQIIPISNFYNTMLDYSDLVADFDAWEGTKTRFTFCQYPFFLSIYAKIHILEYDARRQMEVKAREAFFDSILTRRAVSQFLVFRVRRDCLVEDSLRNVREVVGAGAGDIKKGLRIDFADEEGIDAGGLRKEWFLLLIREIFDPEHGLFVYDEDSQYCYFNPFCFESSEQFFLVGVLLGLAIYNSTILDVAFPPFVFKKMLSSAPSTGDKLTSIGKPKMTYTLEDLAEFRPSLARGLRQLLEFDSDVQETFCRDFVIEMDRYGELVRFPLCANGEKRAVTNSNRKEFVDLYIHYLLDTVVARQYEPFKRGFFTVCGGNALSLFRPEEIELLVRGSEEPLDIASLRAVAAYEGWPTDNNTPPEHQPQVEWFWDFFARIAPASQRKVLSFITGSDRIPAMGATNLVIRVLFLKGGEAEQTLDREIERFPIARTCFNTIGLYAYHRRQTLEEKLWMAVLGSEGFGLR